MIFRAINVVLINGCRWLNDGQHKEYISVAFRRKNDVANPSHKYCTTNPDFRFLFYRKRFVELPSYKNVILMTKDPPGARSVVCLSLGMFRLEIRSVLDHSVETG